MNHWKQLTSSLVMTLLVLGLAGAQETPPKEEKNPTKENTSIKDVMKAAHKKPNDLLKRVALGKASKEDQKKLLTLYKIMAQHKPEKGEASSWKQKTELVVEAAEAVVADKPDATKQLSKATNCKGCHSVHKK